MRRTFESYRYLADAVGAARARQLSRAELVTRVARRLGGPGWAAVQAPSLDMLVRTMPTAMTAHEVLIWAGLGEVETAKLLEEFHTVADSLEMAYDRVALTCPPEWAVESSTSAILYALARHRRPQRVVETGIANGHSSHVLLAALRANDFGQLVSVDVRSDVGVLVDDGLAKRWTKVVIDDQRPGLEVLRERVGAQPVDLFFHDGDHRFLGQMLDYRLATELLTPGGLLMSDDINTTSAWVDARNSGLLSEDGLILLDRRKAVGFARHHPVS